nr:hypothetical protein [Propionibacterium sp.]
MPRRVDLPGAAELFRPTGPDAVPPPAVPPAPAQDPEQPAPAQDAPRLRPGAAPSPSGRVRHEEKITVYVSSEELLALERLRLTLRAEHGLAVDRGRIIRAAVAEAIADVYAHGGAARLVQRLTP